MILAIWCDGETTTFFLSIVEWYSHPIHKNHKDYLLLVSICIPLAYQMNEEYKEWVLQHVFAYSLELFFHHIENREVYLLHYTFAERGDSLGYSLLLIIHLHWYHDKAKQLGCWWMVAISHFPRSFHCLVQVCPIKHQEPFEVFLMVFSMWDSQIYPVCFQEVVLLQALVQEGWLKQMQLQIHTGNVLITCLECQNSKRHNVCSNPKTLSLEMTCSDQLFDQ